MVIIKNIQILPLNNMNKRKKINIAIVGLGNIGSYFYKYIVKNKKNLINKTKFDINKIYISARNINKKRSFKINKSIFLKNYLDVAKKKDINVIIELIGGSEGAAKKLVFSALRNKKHVITANKALIAKYGDQLSIIAEKNNVNLEFEAAVCAGVPIIRTLKEGLISNKNNKIYGIFNGTSNYILSTMDQKSLNFKEALYNAQTLGYAEAKPLSDLNGDDVASKLKILSSLSFNTYINNKISIEGIKNVDKDDIYNANLLGYKIKLLGVAEYEKNKIIQRVHPALIKKGSYVSNIDGVLNAVIIESNQLGQTVLQGEGAGPGATTSALVSDLCSVLRGNIKYPFVLPSKKRSRGNFKDISEKKFSAYFRLDVKDKHGVLSNITNILSKNGVSVKRLIQKPMKTKKNSSIVIITHNSDNRSLIKSINILQKKKYLINKPKFIRIEDI